ncbi:MAG: hypothetical protein U0904_11550 [Candidatus Nanopelagicales bacterium]|nr:hypothetical protein [Candidatus Nanopelagicales bacterium]
MGLSIPAEGSGWRCGQCGNLTRFDVTRSRTVTEYWHFTLAGDRDISELAVRSEAVQDVRCRWCGSSDSIEVVARPEAEGTVLA